MSRRTLTARQWPLIAPLVPGKKGDRGRTGRDNGLFIDTVLWMARTAAPWRDRLPELGELAHGAFALSALDHFRRMGEPFQDVEH